MTAAGRGFRPMQLPWQDIITRTWLAWSCCCGPSALALGHLLLLPWQQTVALL